MLVPSEGINGAPSIAVKSRLNNDLYLRTSNWKHFINIARDEN
jgi:hypothetical protein